MTSTYFLDLLFVSNEVDVPGARAYVCTKKTQNVITHEAFSADELDEYINSLRHELDVLSAKAHKAFAENRRSCAT